MSNPEFRVRPVVRHVVTRYTRAEPLPPGVNADTPRGGLETLGEFDSEGYAEIVAEALAEKAAPREYVIVQSTLGEVTAKVYYAYGEQEAQERMNALQVADSTTYRIYSRIQRPL
jgi:hypothetical protein